MIGQVLLTVLPVLVVVMVGYLYAHKVGTDVDAINRVNMAIFLPALVFSALATRRFDAQLDGWLILATVVIVVGSGLLALPIARWLVVDAKTFCPPMMFSNSGTLGLPLALLAFGEAAFSNAMLLFVTTNLLFFTLGAYLIGRNVPWRQILLSPVVLATFLGMGCGMLALPMPEVVMVPAKMMGNVALPLMLFALGVRMTAVRRSDLRVGFAGALICPLSGLVVAGLLIPWIPLSAEYHPLLLLFAVLPPAVVNHLLAETYRRDPEQVAAIVVVGHLLSVLFVPLGLSLGLASFSG
ncbi:AEC family transporter [Sedimenticola sp.]|uniref:AEC family transporter n=1 Tax=Sedimenticola sp. TaxID=1940285 RepID=UPI003D111468